MRVLRWTWILGMAGKRTVYSVFLDETIEGSGLGSTVGADAELRAVGGFSEPLTALAKIICNDGPSELCQPPTTLSAG